MEVNDIGYLMAQKAIVEQASKELIVQVNKYANYALKAGEEKAETNTDTTIGNVKYAISILEEMIDRCESPIETLRGLKRFIGEDGSKASIYPITSDDLPF